MRRKHSIVVLLSMAMMFGFSPVGYFHGSAEAKLDCSPTADKSLALPQDEYRTDE